MEADAEALAPPPIPIYLRNAQLARMKSHGIGAGGQCPHQLPGAGVEQRGRPLTAIARSGTADGRNRSIDLTLERARTALVMIDLQRGIVDAPTSPRPARDIVDRMAALAGSR